MRDPSNSDKYITAEEANARRALSAVVSERLRDLYPEAVCALEYAGEPWRLMVMGRLSAQCTDKRVNEVCRTLFSKYPTPAALAAADVGEVEEIVRPCGLFHVKAADVVGECAMLCEEYGGELPSSMDELLKFPGVGRKIANLLLGDVFGKGGIVADTHCIRICGRLGFYPEEWRDPVKTEAVMSRLIPEGEQSDFCHRIVSFGRDVCRARDPACVECPMRDVCAANRSNRK